VSTAAPVETAAQVAPTGHLVHPAHPVKTTGDIAVGRNCGNGAQAASGAATTITAKHIGHELALIHAGAAPGSFTVTRPSVPA
jgi:hypothetical protein